MDPSRITLVIALAYLSIMLAVGTLILYFSTRRSRTGVWVLDAYALSFVLLAALFFQQRDVT
ncbi:MAG: hypothetical protein M3309_13145 [Actinomycetota bacterium]|nr:hypothetical protein [Actinomycetota bacterium]